MGIALGLRLIVYTQLRATYPTAHDRAQQWSMILVPLVYLVSHGLGGFWTGADTHHIRVWLIRVALFIPGWVLIGRWITLFRLDQIGQNAVNRRKWIILPCIRLLFLGFVFVPEVRLINGTFLLIGMLVFALQSLKSAKNEVHFRVADYHRASGDKVAVPVKPRTPLYCVALFAPGTYALDASIQLRLLDTFPLLSKAIMFRDLNKEQFAIAGSLLTWDEVMGITDHAIIVLPVLRSSLTEQDIQLMRKLLARLLRSPTAIEILSIANDPATYDPSVLMHDPQRQLADAARQLAASGVGVKDMLEIIREDIAEQRLTRDEITDQPTLKLNGDISRSVKDEFVPKITIKNRHYQDLLHSEERTIERNLMLRGFGDIPAMYRQTYETMDNAVRFMTYLDIFECAAHYLVAFIHMQPLESSPHETPVVEEFSFGKTVSVLSQWIKADDKGKDTPTLTYIRQYLQRSFTDDELQKSWVSFVNGSLHTKLRQSNSRSILEILDCMTVLRNRTRGHGSPTRVSLELTALMQRMLLRTIGPLISIPGQMVSGFQEESAIRWFSYHDGGAIEPIISKAEQELSDTMRATPGMDVQGPFWLLDGKLYSLRPYILVRDARVFLLSRVRNSKLVYSSHSTGEHFRPGIEEADL